MIMFISIIVIVMFLPEILYSSRSCPSKAAVILSCATDNLGMSYHRPLFLVFERLLVRLRHVYYCIQRLSTFSSSPGCSSVADVKRTSLADVKFDNRQRLLYRILTFLSRTRMAQAKCLTQPLKPCPGDREQGCSSCTVLG